MLSGQPPLEADLRRQLLLKDDIVSSVQNELFKLKAELADARKAEAEASYQLGQEAESLRKANEQLVKSDTELKQYKLRLANADEAVRTAQQAAAPAAGAGADTARLEEQVRTLERELADARSHAGGTSSSAAAAAPAGTRSGLPVAHSSRLPQRGGASRRSSSTSTFSTFDGSAGAPSSSSTAADAAALATLRQRLPKLQAELLGAHNAQVAAERALGRAQTAAAERVDALEDELRAVRAERAELEGTVKALRKGGGAVGALAEREKDKLRATIGALEARVGTLEKDGHEKDAALADLTASTAAELTALTTDLGAAQAWAASLETQVGELTARATAADARAAELDGALEAARAGQEGREELAQVLAEAREEVGQLKGEKEELAARLTTLTAELAQAEAALAAAESTGSHAAGALKDTADQLAASHAACAEAEGEITRLERALSSRPEQATCDALRAALEEAQAAVADARGERARADEAHQRALEDARTAQDAADGTLGKLRAKLASREAELAELTRALNEQPPPPPPPPPPPAPAAPANERNVSAREEAADADGALRMTREEAEGVERLNGAVVRLRAERDALRLEVADLQRSLAFSETETAASQQHVAALTSDLAQAAAEHDELSAILQDSLRMAEGLQDELDRARAASAAAAEEAERLLALEGADGRAARAQLVALEQAQDAVRAELAAAVAARDAALGEMQEKEDALARAAEERQALVADVREKERMLAKAAEERDAALGAVVEKDAALERAAEQAVAAPSFSTEDSPSAKAVSPSSPSPSHIATLVSEKEALEARLARRNASIEKQGHELAKLTTSHALLKDSFDDLEEELAELTSAKEALVAEVAQHVSAQEALQADLADARSTVERLETAALAAAPSEYTEEQVAALVGVVFATQHASRAAPPPVAVGPPPAELEQQLADTAVRLETALDQLTAARERSLALEAQLAADESALHAALEAATERLESVEGELTAVLQREAAEKAVLGQGNAALACRLDRTTASLNARAIEVLGARAETRSLVVRLQEKSAQLETAGEEAAALRLENAEHLTALASAQAALDQSAAHLSAVEKEALAARTQLQADNDDLRDKLAAAQAELAEKAAELDSATAAVSLSAEDSPAPEALLQLETEVARLTAVVAERETALQEKDAALVQSVDSSRRDRDALARASDVQAALEQQVETLQAVVREVHTTKDALELGQAALREEIAALQSALPSADRSVADRAEDVAVPAQVQLAELQEKHSAALDLVKEAEETILALQSKLETAEETLSAARASPQMPSDDVATQLADIETKHQALIAAHDETLALYAASRQAEASLQGEATSRRLQLDDMLDGLSKLQQDHAAITHAKSLAEGQVAQVLAAKEDALRQLGEEHAKALALVERAKAVKAEEARELEEELKAAKASLSEAIARSEAQDGVLEARDADLARLQQEVASAKQAAEDSAARLSDVEESIQQLETDKAAAVAELESVKAVLAEQTTALEDRDRLHTETKDKLDRLQAHIANVETKLDAAELRLGRQKARHDDEMAALERSLAEAQSAGGSPAEGSVEEKIADLEDHVQRLIASLDQKNIEVEEADDKIIAMLKDKKKAERKIELLQKKLDKAIATAAAAAVVPGPPVVAVAPPPAAAPLPRSPLNPSAAVFVSASPVRGTTFSPAAPPAPPSNIFATPSVHANPLSSSQSSSHAFTPVSHRPIAGIRRVSAEHASQPGSPRARISSAPAIASPRHHSVFTTSENLLPPPAPSSSIGTKRSRPAELEQVGPTSVMAVHAPAPSSILAPASGNTPRRAPLLSRKVDQKGFTPKRSERTAALLDKRDAAGLGAGVTSRLGGLTLGKEGLQQASGGLKGSSGDLMSRLAAMRR